MVEPDKNMRNTTDREVSFIPDAPILHNIIFINIWLAIKHEATSKELLWKLFSSMTYVHKHFIENILLLSNGFEIERENFTSGQI